MQLQPHPEGGYFSESYRSTTTLRSGDKLFPDGRCYSTAIYYLLGSGDISRFHRIRSDEVWHHYEGSPITIHMIHDDGFYEVQYLGKDLIKSQKPQLVVHAGIWFGATVDKTDSFALCGCTVSPGFDFADFEMADRNKMLHAFPEHESIIRKLLPG